MKAAYYDLIPVVNALEHKRIVLEVKFPVLEDAKTSETFQRLYYYLFGKANIVLAADETNLAEGETVCIILLMARVVYWSKAAC
jgi:hypothetical protein